MGEALVGEVLERDAGGVWRTVRLGGLPVTDRRDWDRGPRHVPGYTFGPDVRITVDARLDESFVRFMTDHMRATASRGY